MSLLEGHANVVMDAVDASIVPSVKTIRQRFNARGKDRGAIEKFIRSLLGLDAKMRSTATARSSSAKWSTPPGWKASTGSGSPPTTSPPNPKSTTRSCGSSGWGFSPRARPPHPDLPAVPGGRRRPGRLAPVVGKARKMLQDALADAGYPARVLVACSGGPDSLALAAVAAYFARRGHVDGHPVTVGAVVVDHQLQPGSADVAAAAATALRELGLAPVQVRAVDVAPTGMGPEAAARDAGTRPSRRAPTTPEPPPSCWATPWTTRPNRSCWAWPAAPEPARWPGCGRSAAACCGHSWACAGPRRWKSAPSRDWTPGTTPATRTPPLRGPGPVWRCCRCWRRSSARGLRVAGQDGVDPAARRRLPRGCGQRHL